MATARAGLVSAVVAGLAAGVLAAAPVAAEAGPEVVRGTAMPAGTGLTFLDCTVPLRAGTGPVVPRVGRDARAPLGQRSLGIDLGSTGSAVGPVTYTASLAAAGPATLAVSAPAGTTGAAWVGWHDPAGPATQVLVGRAPLAVDPGGWRDVSTAGLTFTWSRLDTATGAVLDADVPAPSGVDALVAERGDGPGFTAVTLGCDGAPFAVDAWRADGTTLDLEGLATDTLAGPTPTGVVAGETTTIRGTLEVRPGGTVPRATAVLERRTAGSADWQAVRVVRVGRGGALSAVVAPPENASYRWRFVDRPLAEGSTSAPVDVAVARAVTVERADGGLRGRVAPGTPGLRVSLLRAGVEEVAASTTTGPDGVWTLDADRLAGLEAGSYTVRVEGGATNEAGRSDVVRLAGRSAPSSDPRPTREPEPTREPSSEPEPAPPAATAPTEQPAPAEPTSTPTAGRAASVVETP